MQSLHTTYWNTEVSQYARTSNGAWVALSREAQCNIAAKYDGTPMQVAVAKELCSGDCAVSLVSTFGKSCLLSGVSSMWRQAPTLCAAGGAATGFFSGLLSPHLIWAGIGVGAVVGCGAGSFIAPRGEKCCRDLFECNLCNCALKTQDSFQIGSLWYGNADAPFMIKWGCWTYCCPFLKICNEYQQTHATVTLNPEDIKA